MSKLDLVVTGGRGFIGGHFVELALANGHNVTNIDVCTYASCPSRWNDFPNYKEIIADIKNLTHLPQCDFLVNFAAESHVDNSIAGPDVFIESNFLGTYNLLKLVAGKVYQRPTFVQISTDEVYGDVRKADFEFTELHAIKPSNPYSASKAAAEMLLPAFHKTHGVNYIITRSSNNYGPYQYYEKLIPQCIKCLREGRKIPIHGDGSYVRDWIYVKDNVKAIMSLIEQRQYTVNQIFNIAANNNLSNLEIVKRVCGWFNKPDWQNHMTHVENRLGQDLRYSISSNKIKQFVGWEPEHKTLFNFLEQ